MTYIIIAIVLTAGTAFLMWLGEQITAKGVGNGISIIIFAGIVAAIPNAVNQVYAQQIEGAGDALFINIVIVRITFIGNCRSYGWSYLRYNKRYVKFLFNTRSVLLGLLKRVVNKHTYL